MSNTNDIQFPLPQVHEKSYRCSARIGSRDVNLYRRLKTSALFELLQDLSVVHADILGFGTMDAVSRGIVWVITMQRVEITRLPQEGELVYMETWTGKTSHLLYPRFYRIYDEAGEMLIQASALWTLMDIESRKMVSTEQFGREMIDMTNGCEIALPSAPKKAGADNTSSFTVPYSYLDQNGHMNNTRYFDLAEDLIPAPIEGKRLRSILSRYAAEARLGDVIELQWQEKDGLYRISGGGDKKIFTINLEYYED